MAETTIEGIVIKSTGSWYTVLDPHSGRQARCRIRGVFRLRGSRTTSPVVVGDRVRAEIGEDEGDNVIVETARGVEFRNNPPNVNRWEDYSPVVTATAVRRDDPYTVLCKMVKTSISNFTLRIPFNRLLSQIVFYSFNLAITKY